jgi:hypothetical protein
MRLTKVASNYFLKVKFLFEVLLPFRERASNGLLNKLILGPKVEIKRAVRSGRPLP